MGSPPIESFVTKTAAFTYKGQRLSLALSQSLFSSHEVDRGSALLLKSIARIPLPASPAVLDVGCGTGVLGIAIARDQGDARVTFQDRDALAVAFSALNCRANGVIPAAQSGELAMDGLGDSCFDLILSNLPAKAGQPVHAHIVRSMAARLRPGGLACLVIVTPLAERIAAALGEAGLSHEELERTSSHVVFHAKGGRPVEGDARPDPLAPYLRRSGAFSGGGATYGMDAVYDLPEFDTLSHTTLLAMETLKDPLAAAGVPRGTLLWNPGQGHLAAWLLARKRRAGASPFKAGLTLGSRDLLQLRVSARNAAAAAPRLVHAWDPALAGGPFGCAVVLPDDDPHVPWDSALPELFRQCLAPSGTAVVSSGATFVARMLRHCRGLRLVRSRKKLGFRCVLLERA